VMLTFSSVNAEADNPSATNSENILVTKDITLTSRSNHRAVE
jgi:hypothetical protein